MGEPIDTKTPEVWGDVRRFGEGEGGVRLFGEAVAFGLVPVGVFGAVEVDVFRGEVGGVDGVSGVAHVEVDADGEGAGLDGFPEVVGRGVRLESSPAGGESGYVDVDEFFTDVGARVADGMDDAAPVRVVAVP